MIEIKHLKTLKALVETNSINRAAEKLCMTQSALSHQLKLFEEQLGLELFRRKTHPIEWTPAGELLLQTAQEVLLKVHYAERQLMALKQGEFGRLWIGVDCHTCFEWLLPLLRPYQEKWPSIDLDIVPSFNTPPLQKLQLQQVDFVVTSDPEPIEGIEYTALFSYELVAVLSPNHELLSKEYFVPADFETQTLIVYPVPEKKLDIFSHFLEPAGIKPNKVTYSELTLMMLQRVELGRGICVLPKWLLENQADFQHLPWRSLGQEGLWTKLYSATPKEQTVKPYVQEMITLIADQMTL
ncbi:transcriptional regulator MetR [Thiomicrorhabdus hydrogeniphila]